MGIVWSYSAACLAASAIMPNTFATRSAKPGLLGRKPVSISLGMPFNCASLKRRVLPLRNRAAATGPSKSATLTAHADSYSVHSGLIPSGFSDGSSCLVCICKLFPAVGLTQRYNAQSVTTQNKYQNMEPVTNHSARHESLLAIVNALIGKGLGRDPVETGGIGKMQSSLCEVAWRLCLVPLQRRFHPIIPTFCSVLQRYHNQRNRRKLYIPVDNSGGISSPLCSERLL